MPPDFGITAVGAKRPRQLTIESIGAKLECPALPDVMNRPAQSAELAIISVIALLVLQELRHPVCAIRFRKSSVPTRVTVPKAPLDLNDGSILRKNDVRASRQATHMQAESESEPVKCLSDKHLRLRILRSYARHIRRPRSRSFAFRGFHLTPW